MIIKIKKKHLMSLTKEYELMKNKLREIEKREIESREIESVTLKMDAYQKEEKSRGKNKK